MQTNRFRPFQAMLIAWVMQKFKMSLQQDLKSQSSYTLCRLLPLTFNKYCQNVKRKFIQRARANLGNRTRSKKYFASRIGRIFLQHQIYYKANLTETKSVSLIGRKKSTNRVCAMFLTDQNIGRNQKASHRGWCGLRDVDRDGHGCEPNPSPDNQPA